GAVEETVTVTGASPVVDVRNVTSESVLKREVLDTLPTAKNASAFAALTVGAVTSARDVGGSAGDRAGKMSVHGTHTDGITKFEGLSLEAYRGQGDRRLHANQMAVQEVAVESRGMTAEAETGGVQVSVVPKDGGNTFTFSSSIDYSPAKLYSSNLNDAL